MNKKRIYIGFIVIIIAIAAISLGIGEKTTSRTLAFDTLDRGTIGQGFFSGQNEKGTFIVETEEVWRDMWKKLHSIRTPQPELPEVDFSNEIIIAVFQGLKNTGGFDIEITEIIESDSIIEISIKETSPGSRCGVITAETQPYEIIKLKRTDKQIEFSLEQEVIDCE